MIKTICVYWCILLPKFNVSE